MAIQTITERTDAECYIAAAPWIVEAIEVAVAKNGHCCLGIVGGRSIGAILDKLIPYVEELKGHIEVFWLDERIHHEKNYVPALPVLETLARHGVDVAWHPLLATHKEAVAAEVQQTMELLSARGTPVFDVVIMSAGEDGHICSLFPQSPELHVTTLGYALVEHAPKAPPMRVTVTPPLLLTAQHAFLFFIGEKREAYAKFQNPAVSSDDCPAKLVEKIPSASVFVCVR